MMTEKPSKVVGQGELVFGLLQLFTSKSLCARFQISGYSGYDLCHDSLSQTYRPTDRLTDCFRTGHM